MADPGRGEGGGQVAVHAVAQPDQDGRGQPALRLGQDLLERVAGRLAEGLEPAGERVVVADERQRRGLARGGDPLARRGTRS